MGTRKKQVPVEHIIRAAPREPAASPDRWKLCGVCGQLIDTEDLDQVFHHGPERHARMKPQK